MEKDYAEFTAGEKDSEWQCQEHETTPIQKGQYGEINVAEWSAERKTNTDNIDFHAYFTNLVAVMKESIKETSYQIETKFQDMKEENKVVMKEKKA
jgi:hypothetical protein